jgi:antitoxin HigA-1
MPKTWKSSITTKGAAMARRKLLPIHPGEILLEEFLSPLGVSQYRLAKETSVPPRRINEIVRGMRSISADTALRLARYFGTSERFWLNLQTRYDLEVEKDRLGDRLSREVQVFEAVGPR